MCCNCCSVRQKQGWSFTLGCLFTVIGIVLIVLGPSFTRKIIRGKLPLSPSSYSFNKWEKSPVPIYTVFYLFNWTNSHDVDNPDVKPHFEELGPYTFRDYKVKEDLLWDNPNNTVTFFGKRTFTYVPEKSNGSLNDIIIAPNFATMGASKVSRNMKKFVRKAVNFALNRENGTLTMRHTAIEWMFDGFYDHFLDFVERLHSPLIPIYTNEFAWFYDRNNSKEAEGTFTIHTGKNDLSQMGDVKMWNGTAHTGYWEGECGRVNGSTGELWAPEKSFDETISIFISDAARFINLFPQKKMNYKGVEAWLYTSTNQTFDSGYVTEDTKCFCVKGRECPKNGVIDFSTVTYRAPVYMSHPHFYMADPLYLENTTGMNPDPQKHSIFSIMEPTLGIPLEMMGQVLISVHVEKDDYIDKLRNVSHNFYAPLFTIQMKAEVSDELLKSIKLALNAPAIAQYIGIGFTVLGVLILALGVWITCANKSNKQADQHKANKAEQKTKEAD